MEKSTEISSKFWNQLQKPFEELNRETLFIDDIISKHHIEKELLLNLNGIKTVFDGGAGYGRFSILLAKQGLKVTHFDISMPMIDKAKEIAKESGVLENMTFIHGELEELDRFGDKEFDLVISFDSPVSYTYPKQKETIENLIRICSKRIIISVYSRLAWTYMFDPAQKYKYILNKNSNDVLVRWTVDNGLNALKDYKPDMEAVNNFYRTGLMEKYEDTIMKFTDGETPWPVSYAFLPDEIEEIMENKGLRNIKYAGPGALSRSIPGEVLINIMKDKKLKNEFLEFCYEYDSQKWVAGMGKDNILINAEM
jgi:2-polyprenyl-3-methyl-5-hydroxy-6-metoxy-1,4-benzoquinol methylase